MVPGVLMPFFTIVRATASTTASPRQSSPMPGPRMTVPSFFTATSVPSGNTVSRWAAKTRCGRGWAPVSSPSTLPTLSVRMFVSPASRSIWANRTPRLVSLKGGASTSHSRT